MVHDAFKEQLILGVNELCLITTDMLIDKLILYKDMLLKWNKSYNLTAITKPDEVLKYHILDGLTLVKYLTDTAFNGNIIDVGSGMGVPGIILAICFNNLPITVLDSNKKKTTFLTQIAIELGLKNLMVENSRVEGFYPTKKFDIITSRAFADLQMFVSLTNHLLSPNGYFLAMKGKKTATEITKIIDYDCETIKVKIPNTTDLRFLVKIKTNEKHNSNC